MASLKVKTLLNLQYSIQMVSRIAEVDGDDLDTTSCEFCEKKAIWDVYWFDKVNPFPVGSYACNEHYQTLKREQN